MGGNDTHDKYGRPYELDEGADKLYDKLEDAREEIYTLEDKISKFREYLKQEIDELYSPSGINIELAQTQEIFDKFLNIFD